MAAHVTKYKKPLNINIGLIIFLFIIVYVIFNVFAYATRVTIAEYQVSQGAIASNNTYRGLILRNEYVVDTNKSGYINYYEKNGSRVSVHDIIYSIDTTGSISDAIQTAGASGFLLNDAALATLSDEIDGFSNSFSSMEFNSAAAFKEDLQSQMTQLINSIAMEELRDSIKNAEGKNTFYKYTAPETGVIAYYVDGYENYDVDDFQARWFSPLSYSKTNLNSNEQITANEPAYKLITNENWNIIVPISKELSKELSENSNMKIRFCKDDFTTNAAYTILEESNEYFLNLSLKNAMIRYINDRYIDLELLVQDKNGLKIPKSAITTKEFFTIPKNYFTKGGDSNSYGLMVQNTAEEAELTGAAISFIMPTIYYETEKYYYIDSESVRAEDVILKPDSTETYMIGTKTGSLIGVYNINKGYAVFKQINIIYENDEYAIVEPKTSYGIALYDHIALDGSKLTEDQLIKK